MSEEERAARYADLFEESHDHASNCVYCPICATIGVLRATKPEVLEHLAVAARELIAAAGILLQEAEGAIGAQEGDQGITPSRPKVRRIDVG